MNKQNVTLSLPKSLIKKAKIIAINKDKSLSQLLRETLEEKVRNEAGYQKARQRQIKYLKMGFELGSEGHIRTSREGLYDRK